MSELKSRVISAISEMEGSRLEAVWYFITRLRGVSWDSIPEVQPDEWDIELLDRTASDAECDEFISSGQAKKCSAYNARTLKKPGGAANTAGP